MARFKNAAQARKAAAEQAGERGGDRAFQQFRSAAPGVGDYRQVTMPTEMRAQSEERNGKQMIHTSGYFTRYERAYPMWDKFGEYQEMTMRGSGRVSLAANPDVAFLVNHKGVTMARTRARTKDATLILREDHEGAYHDAWLNPDRQDVRDLVSALNDELITEMSYAFMIPDGCGLWSDDFDVFQILRWDIDRGDVSAVNYGASHHTDIAARSGEILAELELLPEGAREEARSRLAVDAIEARVIEREQIRVGAWVVDRTASMRQRLLSWTKANTARRIVELADATGAGVRELVGAQLPWYEIRSPQVVEETEPTDDMAGEVTLDGDVTEVLVYDEIGGSMGVSADQFAIDLATIDTPYIHLRINSPGGSVFDALAIANSLRHHPATVTSFVDGLAASAATIVALGASPYDPETGTGGVVVMPGGEFMVHRASSPDEGNEEEKDQMAIWLRKQDVNIAQQYADKAGGTPAEWLAMMRAETWFLGQEALDAGLVDRLWRDSATQKGRSKRFADDPRLTRDWNGASLPYRYERRAGAPQTQIRKATGVRDDRFARGGFIPGVGVDDQGRVFANTADGLQQVATMAVPEDPQGVSMVNGSIQASPGGRSISLIMAQVEAEGGDLT